MGPILLPTWMVSMMMVVVLVVVCIPALGSEGLSQYTLILTDQTVLSGPLGACDPSHTMSTCVGGIASVTALARQRAANMSSHVIIIPTLDVVSPYSRLHSLGAGSNIEFYTRVRNQFLHNSTNVLISNYLIPPSFALQATPSESIYSVSPEFKPLATTMLPPPSSLWHFFVDGAVVTNLTSLAAIPFRDVLSSSVSKTPLMATLLMDDSQLTWTASTNVNPYSSGTRLNATHFTFDSDETAADTAHTYSAALIVGSLVRDLHRTVGLVMLLYSDKSIPVTTFLEDLLAMELEELGRPTDRHLSYLPDVVYFTEGTAPVSPHPITITSTFVPNRGNPTTRTRTVLYCEIASGGSSVLDLQLNISSILKAANAVTGSVDVQGLIGKGEVQLLNDTALPDTAKDALYFEDQAYLLTQSRKVIAADRVVGNTSTTMPAISNGPITYTCYAGECAQGTLIARSLYGRFRADVAFVTADGLGGSGWAAGNVTMLNLYDAFPRPEMPCVSTLLGLRLVRLVSASIEASKFLTTFTLTGSQLLQAHGMQIDYGVGADGYGVLVGLRVLNRTTGMYEKVQRLQKYVVVTNDFQCKYQTGIAPFFSSLYRDESTEVLLDNDVIQTTMERFLAGNSPYDPTPTNYYTEVPASEIASGALSSLVFPTGVTSCTTTQYYDEGIASCMDCTEGYQRSQDDSSTCIAIPKESSNTPLIIGVVVGGGVLIAIVLSVGAYCEYQRRSGSRSNRNAPKGGGKDVALIFTDIKSSTRLWGAAPVSMGIALDAHHSLIRAAIGKYQGYEVKTVGDSFMVAVGDAQQAVDMAVAIQLSLFQHKWPNALDCVYMDRDDDVIDDPDDTHGPEADSPWNGLRVRIGIHYGPVEVILDEVTKGYDYYGPTVNVAARVEGVADGGQVCVTSALMNAIKPSSSQYTSALLAKTTLRGVRDDVELYEVRPNGLEGRRFANPLVFNEATKAVTVLEAAKGLLDTNASVSTAGTDSRVSFIPLTSATRPVRNAVREAFKALRGKDRIHILESLRRAWRIDLPSGRPFTGLTEEQMVLKQRRVTKGRTNGRHRTKRAPSVMLSNHSETVSETVSQGTAQTTQTKEEDEDDEDTIFRVVAQRIATNLKRDNSSCGSLSQSHTPTAAAGAAIHLGDSRGTTTTTLRDAHSQLQWSTDFSAPFGSGGGGGAAIHDEGAHTNGGSAQEDGGGGGARPSSCLFSECTLASSLDRADIMAHPHRQTSI